MGRRIRIKWLRAQLSTGNVQHSLGEALHYDILWAHMISSRPTRVNVYLSISAGSVSNVHK
jgi:hypothetical protein